MMKKLLFAATATLAISSCTMQETDNVADTPREPIRFEAFVDKATRAEDVTTDNLKEFYVYGKIIKSDKTETIDGIKVTKLNDGSWYYRDILYWEEGAQYYFFATNNEHAEVIGTSEDDYALLIDSHMFKDIDLIAANSGLRSSYAPVTFKFKHILAKLKFTFTNGYEDGHEIGIKDLNFPPTYEDVTFTWACFEDRGTWKNTTITTFPSYEPGNLSFTRSGESGTVTHLIIPQQLQDIETRLAFMLVVDQKKHYCAVDIPIDVVAEWEAGHTYNYKLTVKPAPVEPEAVEFEMAVEDWGNAKDADLEDVKISEN